MNSAEINPLLSHSVLETVAEAEDSTPLELEVPLYDAIDPDALDSLFEATDGAPHRTGKVTFTYCDHTVVVSSDGTVRLTGDRPKESL